MESLGMHNYKSEEEKIGDLAKEIKQLLIIWDKELYSVELLQFDSWIDRSGLVAEKLELTRLEHLRFIKCRLLEIIIRHLKKKHNYYTNDFEKFISNNNITQIMEQVSNLTSQFNKVKKECGEIYDEFQMEMKKVEKQSTR